MPDEHVTSKDVEQVTWSFYLMEHEQLLRRCLARVPWNCQLRSALCDALELVVKTRVEDFKDGK